MKSTLKKFKFLIFIFLINFSAATRANFEMSQELNLYLARREINQTNLSQEKNNSIISQFGWFASNIRYSNDGQFNLELKPEIRHLRDDGVSLFKTDPAYTTISPVKRYFPLEWRLQKEKNSETYLSLEKAKLSFQSNNLEAYAGRKSVSLGTLRIFPVWNKFSKISPLSFAAPQIIATQDGGGVRYQQDDKMFQMISVIDENEEKNAYIAEAVFFGEIIETHFLAARWWNANALGFAFTKDLLGMSLKGEALYIPNGKNLNQEIFQAGFGGEYAFTETISAFFEYFYESNGHSKKEDYKITLPDRFAFLQSKSYLYTQAIWKLTPTFSLSQGLLINSYDKSTLILSKADYSFSESTDFTMALSTPTGAKGSEFSTNTFNYSNNKSLGSPTILSLAMKVFF